MKLIVTGSTGFIATNFILVAKSFGHEIYTSLWDIAPYQKTDAVIHLGAISGIKDCEQAEREDLIDRNITSCIAWAQRCKEQNKRLIFASSACLYRDGGLDHLYGWSKDAAEKAIKAIHDNVVILRFANVFGPHSIHKNSVIHKFIRQMIKGEQIEIHGDGTQKRDFVHVYDVCKRILGVVEPEGLLKTIRVGSGVERSINEIAYRLNAIFEGERPPQDKFQEQLYNLVEWYKENWRPVCDLVEWYKENRRPE